MTELESDQSSGPLTGIRVLDFTRVVAGPYATMLLADLGADVIKVEQPGRGDDCRAWGPPFVGEDSAYFIGLNRNKRSIALDLSTSEGAAIARRLADRCDVVIESFRPGIMERFGLDYATLSAQHPDLVYCSITAYGKDGPYSHLAGYDAMVSALGGLMGITGTPEGEPVKVGVAVLDVATGLYSALGISAAVSYAQRTGTGQRVDASLLSTQLAILINAATSYLLAGEVLTPQGSAHSSIVPYQAFRANDGWILVGAANDKLFGLLANELGHPEWVNDERFASNRDRVAHRDELIALLEEALGSDSVESWFRRLGNIGVAAAPINRIDQVFADPQVEHIRALATIAHPTQGDLSVVAPALRMSRTPPTIKFGAPRLGQHTDEVLEDLLGLSSSEREELASSGVIAK